MEYLVKLREELDKVMKVFEVEVIKFKAQLDIIKSILDIGIDKVDIELLEKEIEKLCEMIEPSKCIDSHDIRKLNFRQLLRRIHEIKTEIEKSIDSNMIYILDCALKSKYLSEDTKSTILNDIKKNNRDIYLELMRRR